MINNPKAYLMAASNKQIGCGSDNTLYVFEVLGAMDEPKKIRVDDSLVRVESGASVIDQVAMEAVCPSLSTGSSEVVHCLLRCDIGLLAKYARDSLMDSIGYFPESTVAGVFDSEKRQRRLKDEASTHLIEEGAVSLPYFIVSSPDFGRKMREKVFEIEGGFGLVMVKMMPAPRAGIKI